MKIVKKISFIVVLLIVTTQVSTANPYWGKTGHRTIGEIANQYLKNKTKHKIAELLNGQSLALVSTFADDIKSDRHYDEFYTWHYVNMPFNVDYQHSIKNKKGDLVTGIAKCKEVIKDKNSTKEEKAFYLKLLVHLIGDLHQPMHAGRKEDKGGNMIQVQWFGAGTNLHAVWDTKMINQFGMAYTELADNADKISKEQVKFLEEGSIIDWVNETHKLSIKTYASVKVGENLRYAYMYNHFALVRSQLQKGGIRLAKVLDDLFS
ncbi:S1/P1 nuclease [Lutibacter profundi]|nr:S1/P1 nuclease [Lutibacter profundi]